MSDDVTLVPVDDASRPVLEHVGQLYLHDLSDLSGDRPDASGHFDFPRLERFGVDADHHAYLIQHGGRVAGFCLVRPFDDGSTFLHAFFVLRGLRRAGVGGRAAAQLLALHPGPWSIAYLDDNAEAAKFWPRVATRAVGDAWTLTRRPSPDGTRTFAFLSLLQAGGSPDGEPA
jgi:predicted acetyltransferase